jgi:hypothetical protein
VCDLLAVALQSAGDGDSSYAPKSPGLNVKWSCRAQECCCQHDGRGNELRILRPKKILQICMQSFPPQKLGQAGNERLIDKRVWFELLTGREAKRLLGYRTRPRFGIPVQKGSWLFGVSSSNGNGLATLSINSRTATWVQKRMTSTTLTVANYP